MSRDVELTFCAMAGWVFADLVRGSMNVFTPLVVICACTYIVARMAYQYHQMKRPKKH